MKILESSATGRDRIEVFIRSATAIEGAFVAADLGISVLDKIKDRVRQGQFRSGAWANAPYSDADIKAYKLSEGSGMRVESDTMVIDGIVIDDEDWYWGGYLPGTNQIYRKGKEIKRVNRGDRFAEGSRSNRPAPVFIGGYRKWITKYRGKRSATVVDLNMSGRMLNALDFDFVRSRGSNQFGANMELKVFVSEPFNDIAGITNFYREWLYIEEQDVKEAIEEIGLDFFSERTIKFFKQKK